MNGVAFGDAEFREDEYKLPRFKLVRFKSVLLSTSAAYLVKGLIPRAGLIVIWGPPKCGKSFWTVRPCHARRPWHPIPRAPGATRYRRLSRPGGRLRLYADNGSITARGATRSDAAAAARSAAWRCSPLAKIAKAKSSNRCLDRRARHRAVRAKHATVARLWLKPLVAPFAVIEKLASVCRHSFLGTGDGRIQLHHQRSSIDQGGWKRRCGEHGLMIHQREHDFGYGDKADGECGNGDGELITDHGLVWSGNFVNAVGRQCPPSTVPCAAAR
jgi:hypothetical protein